MAVTTSKTWADLALILNPLVEVALVANGFSQATPVQAACVPLLCQNKDVAVEAVTGSGKTLAFVIPILQRLLKRDPPLKDFDVGAVVISPTRELASQIHRVLTSLLDHIPGLTAKLLSGGSFNLEQACQDICENGANILVTTPGRLNDLLEKKESSLVNHVKALEVLILDEADRLLSMGFEIVLNQIFSYLPKQRRTGLFSATQTEAVESIIRAGLRNPVRIVVKEKSAEADGKRLPQTLNNFFVILQPHQKLNYLISFLRKHGKEKIMVFFSTCASVEYFGGILKALLKCPVTFIHSKRKKGKRENAFSSFIDASEGVLACTDVMARGVDIPDVDWVLQFDPPSSAASFVHRCGRTARIGHTGNALLLLLPNEESYINFLKINQKAPVDDLKEEITVTDLTTKIKQMAQKDRNVYEKGMKAFVSYVQSYSKHECRYLLRVKDLDFCGLAKGFGLLKIPHMPELKGTDMSGFQEEDIDLNQVGYLDKGKEEKRQEKLKQWKETGENPFLKKKKAERWSEAKGKKEDKKAKRDERKEKKKLKDKKRKQQMTEEDLKDLADDIKLIKKFKKGKMKDDEFDKAFLDDEDDSTC